MQRLRRFLVPAIALVGLAIVSFLIALAARGTSTGAPVDAAVIVVPDAKLAAPDAAPKVAVDAAATIDAGPLPTTLLSLRTTPDGATVRVGDQVRIAPAELAVSDGTHTVIAELDGWVAERREVTMLRGERVVLEIVFTKRVAVPRPPPNQKQGKLVVATNPYSDVFHGAKPLGQTPFEIDLPVGTYVLTFKNDRHPTTTRTVKVLANKPTRLKFDLPK